MLKCNEKIVKVSNLEDLFSDRRTHLLVHHHDDDSSLIQTSASCSATHLYVLARRDLRVYVKYWSPHTKHYHCTTPETQMIAENE